MRLASHRDAVSEPEDEHVHVSVCMACAGPVL